MDAKRKISCQRCQLRKIKCTRIHPCSNCVQAGHDCNFRSDDSKRRPVGRNYVVALERGIAQYESLLRKAKAASGEERSALLDSISFDDHFPSTSQQIGLDNDVSLDDQGCSRMATMSLQPSPQGSLLFHGPTSMYQKDISLNASQEANSADDQVDLKVWHSLGLPPNMRVEDDIINKALSLFFMYLYPQYMFIYREAFLEDYHENAHNGKYWSYPLVYAICALGLRASSDTTIREKAAVLYHCAETMIMPKALGRPNVTVVQALLCLAFYELGAGNHSKGWVLAGMAFRMAQDLGFQQDPKFLISQDSTIASDQDLVIRRRVYYGLYLSDKVISLYLGRPVMLYEEEAAVDLPEPLPDFPPDHDWYGLNELAESDLGHLGGIILMPSFERLIELGKIIEDMIFKVFSTKMIKKPQKELVLARSSRLEELSVRLGKWHSSLPAHLSWNQWNPPAGSLKPHVLILHLLYHSILISLNRHFVRPTPGFPANLISKETCLSSADTIIALIRQFRTQQGLERSPVLVVYAAVMAGSGIFFTQDSTALAIEKDRRLSFILKALEECSQTHNLAKEARIKLQANIDERRASVNEGIDMNQNLPIFQPQIPTDMPQMPQMGWVDGSMFDLGAFDLGAIDPFESMAFRGIVSDPSQWLAASSTEFSADPTLLQNWMSNEPPVAFHSATGQEYSADVQSFHPQNFDTHGG